MDGLAYAPYTISKHPHREDEESNKKTHTDIQPSCPSVIINYTPKPKDARQEKFHKL